MISASFSDQLVRLKFRFRSLIIKRINLTSYTRLPSLNSQNQFQNFLTRILKMNRRASIGIQSEQKQQQKKQIAKITNKFW